MKKIFIFTSVHQWNDVRIFHKEAVSLSRKYNVELHAPADFDFKIVKNVSVHGLPKWKKVIERKKIRKELWGRLKTSDVDVYHFHDPELIIIGLYLKIIKKKKVIYDVHENVTKQILNKDYIPTLFLRKIISMIFSIIERIAISFFDGVIVAGDDILKSYDKRTIINNYPLIETKNIMKTDNDNALVYLGGITKIRGIEEISKAVIIVNKKTNRDLKLKLIGEFSDKEFKEHLLDKYSEVIQFLGWKKREEALDETRKSILGMVLYLPVQNHKFLRSNKIFEYMELGIPILYSNFSDWCNKLDKYNVGLSADPTDPHDIADKICWLLENPSKASLMGKNGKRTIANLFNWYIEEKKLFDLYRKFM